MTFNEEDKITIKCSDKNREFYKLIEFKNKNNNKNYIIYTDGKYTNNKLNTYSSILEEDGENIKFTPVTDEDDLEIIKRVLIGQKIKICE